MYGIVAVVVLHSTHGLLVAQRYSRSILGVPMWTYPMSSIYTYQVVAHNPEFRQCFKGNSGRLYIEISGRTNESDVIRMRLTYVSHTRLNHPYLPHLLGLGMISRQVVVRRSFSCHVHTLKPSLRQTIIHGGTYDGDLGESLTKHDYTTMFCDKEGDEYDVVFGNAVVK